jgi:hypothetical protein
MRLKTVTIAAVLSAALIFTVVPAALANHHGHSRGRTVAVYKVTKPRIADEHVTMGVSFETSGVVTPAIATDDTSTSVSIKVYSLAKKGHSVLVDTVAASLAPATDTTGTVYDATVTLPASGSYTLVAVVTTTDGQTLATSAGRPVFARLPYTVSKPRVLTPKVTAGVSFDATGVVTPAIAADDTSTSVTVFVYRMGRHGRLSQVTTAAATFTGAVGDGTGYSATLSLPSKGTYVLVAVASSDGVVLGRSGSRNMRAVSASGTSSDTPTGTVSPAVHR